MIAIYIAGPITNGDQFVNCRNAILAGEQLRVAGHAPYVPHLSSLWQMIAPVDYEGWMLLDFAWIERCDALLRIPGESSGADREMEHARAKGIPVFLSIKSVLEWAALRVAIANEGV